MNLHEFILIIIQSLWLVLPAYTANSGALLCGGKLPMDFKKNFFDKRRILGDGKTWSGFFGGITIGMGVGSGEMIVVSVLYLYNTSTIFPSFGVFPNYFFILFLLSFGALLGDIIESFIKRRLNISQGKKYFWLTN